MALRATGQVPQESQHYSSIPSGEGTLAFLLLEIGGREIGDFSFVMLSQGACLNLMYSKSKTLRVPFQVLDSSNSSSRHALLAAMECQAIKHQR